ncbi:YjjG family noncanonical pyrimidine nucleotidase [Bacillus sonorensis]|uniref:HAD-hydrolase YfnB n=2 Tax=Bacillus sonorensis TaxID=119858 RepID=M5PB42_9BACI|nr:MULTISPECIES: YjjG family noncanonical pyrimidine nucleotidase [Bacillus]TWK74005.1 putative HAD-hydrolase YfnB [Bacillus paralicheniformis]ASB91305.1 (S)-2-haloacid dehalogenase [Bacillus sonorensis]EME72655.1 HAD-hydrolase YfnB [Bacillus sonorensis L12]MBG9917357.1 HAD family hydrolase [Bacillus sonorensis]MCF7620080.1 YjjG family noncanonical pyrimidine nucleotidase [Bacillus sonorensis]
MKTYRTLFFDVDDTLLDFQAAESLALRLLFEEQNIPLTQEIEADYKRMNQGLWRAFEEGKIDRDEVVNTRFSLLFKKYGRTVDGALLEKKYRGYLEEGHQLIDGALELITRLQRRYDLYIVTNGVSKTQYKRLRDSGLYPLFKGIFVSEDTGYQKPMKEYFDYVFARIPHFSKEAGLIIGDSLTADIKGGGIAGLDTCWLNPGMKPNDTGIVPTYQIQKLDELYHILHVEKESAAGRCFS